MADTFIIPCVPDRLSVRGALYLLDRIRRLGYKKHGLGTLWSLYKGNSTTHKTIMSRAEARESPYDALPPSFSTHIKHTEAFIKTIERRDQPQTFKKKYETLAKSYEGVCEEIRQRLRRDRKVRAK